MMVRLFTIVIILLVAIPGTSAQDAPPANNGCDLSEWLTFIDDNLHDAATSVIEAMEDSQTNPRALFRIYLDVAFVRMTLENSALSIVQCGETAISLNAAGIAYMSAFEDLIVYQMVGLLDPGLNQDAAEGIQVKVEQILSWQETILELRTELE